MKKLAAVVVVVVIGIYGFFVYTATGNIELFSLSKAVKKPLRDMKLEWLRDRTVSVESGRYTVKGNYKGLDVVIEEKDNCIYIRVVGPTTYSLDHLKRVAKQAGYGYWYFPGIMGFGRKAGFYGRGPKQMSEYDIQFYVREYVELYYRALHPSENKEKKM